MFRIHRSQRTAPLSLVAFALLLGCNDEMVSTYDPECDDDAIGRELDMDSVVPLPPAEFGVVCETGWGHGVETRAPSEIVELPNAYQSIQEHPEGGFLLWPYGRVERWSERLGVEIASYSLVWVDEQFEQVHWLRDDLHYRPPTVVDTEAGVELWVYGWNDDVENSGSYSRIDPSTGDLLERVPRSESLDNPQRSPGEFGLWYDNRLSYSEGHEVRGLYRMASFGEAELVREREITTSEWGVVVSGLHPTPGGGVLWGYNSVLESIADDGSLRWTLAEPHCTVVVDDQGSFLLGCVDRGSTGDQRSSTSIQRRSLVDASVLWTRAHHRYDFASTPGPSEYLYDHAWRLATRPGGGYLVTGQHAYPSTTCPGQPVIFAIDAQGEVEWAQRLEVCGGAWPLERQLGGSIVVMGASYRNGDAANGNVEARWVERFDPYSP